jgi:hypothetical protein
MELAKEFVRNGLTIHFRRDQDRLVMMWSGKSDERNPALFLMPLLESALSDCEGKELVLNFRSLDFMNSSSITPILKMLDRAKRSQNRVTIIYRKALKWQELSFSALSVFETPDGRIKVVGL